MRVRRRLTLVALAGILALGLLPETIATAQGENIAPTGRISAQLVAPKTYYTAEVTDQDGDRMKFYWSAQGTCGKFRPGFPADYQATWEHGDDQANCNHESTSHPGTIFLHVDDRHSHWIGCAYEGSEDGKGKPCATAEPLSSGVTVRYVSGRRRLVILASPTICRGPRGITILRRRNRRESFRQIGRARTNNEGEATFRLSEPFTGTYRATTPATSTQSQDPESGNWDFYRCGKASDSVTVR